MKSRKRTNSGNFIFNPKRKLRVWQGNEEDKSLGKALAVKVRYTGNPAHKRNPGDFNLTPPASPRQNATLCDDANVFDFKTATELLKQGARNGLVDSRLVDEFPALIWAVSEAGYVFEAQLENSTKGEYHGYPMPLSDPFRPAILKASKSR